MSTVHLMHFYDGLKFNTWQEAMAQNGLSKVLTVSEAGIDKDGLRSAASEFQQAWSAAASLGEEYRLYSVILKQSTIAYVPTDLTIEQIESILDGSVSARIVHYREALEVEKQSVKFCPEQHGRTYLTDLIINSEAPTAGQYVLIEVSMLEVVEDRYRAGLVCKA